MLLFAGAAFALASRPLAMRSAATEFEAQFLAAQSLSAATANGVTIVIQPRAPSGFKSIVYAGRPITIGALSASNLPSISADADISEAAVGPPPFAIFISNSDHVSMAGNFPQPAQFDSPSLGALATEPACPLAGHYTLRFAANGTSSLLVLPCKIAVAGTPLPIATNSP